jgi:hypothetical protein
MWCQVEVGPGSLLVEGWAWARCLGQLQRYLAPAADYVAECLHCILCTDIPPIMC